MKRLNALAIVLIALAVPASAQQAPGIGQNPGQGQGRAPMTTVQGTPMAQGGRRPGPAQAVNVRLDLTINDQSSTGAPLKKTITMLIADQSNGRVRSSGMVHQQVQRGVGPDGNPVIGMVPQYNVELNVDAMVHLLEDNKLTAFITLEYTPGAAAVSTNESPRPSPLNQSVTVILQNGKPLIITQAADPLSDRKITVEVLATILR